MNCLKLLVAATALGMATQAYAVKFDTSRVTDGDKVSYVDAITGKTHSVVRCGVKDPTPAERDAIEQKLREFRNSSKAPLLTSITVADKIVPVWFNVITTNTGAGNVTDAQIATQVSVLNSSYAGSGFQFTLSGIKRTANTTWYNGCADNSIERTMKRSLSHDPIHNLNVYSCGLGGGLLGYATFPHYYPESSFMHGIVILNAAFPGGSATHYNGGDTVVHETGHYLGLYHPFQGGCTVPGDQIADTPQEATPGYGCPVTRDSCPADPGREDVKDFMDYSDDSCMDHFTTDQRIRAQDQVAIYRPTLGS